MSLEIRKLAQGKNLKPAELLALVPVKDYSDGRTKQSFRDETDINKILKRAQKTGVISHMQKHEGHYGDFADFDFFEAQIMLTKGREIFDALPSEIRNEFNQSQAAFFNYVNDPANKDRIGELLPALAAPGKQNIDLRPEASAADAEGAVAPETKKPEANADEKEKEPERAPTADQAESVPPT